MPSYAEPPNRWRALALDAVRFVGLGVGLLVLVNVVGEIVRPPFETLHAWIGLGVQRWLWWPLALVVGSVLVRNAVAPWRRRGARTGAAACCAAVAAVAVGDAASFYRALAAGAIDTPAVVPSSLVVAGVFGALAAQITWERPARPRLGWRRALAAGGVAAAVVVSAPLVLIATFGPTRYDRRADCAVVLGARAWSDGTPSLALADRVDEAISLYQRGLVPRIVMSGAVDDNGVSEAQVMLERAVRAGVPREAVVLDERGVDSASTVQNAAAMMRAEGLETALVVSHYYHEPRLKMLFDRAGVRAYTVPARMSRRLRREPWFVAREVVAYYHSFLFQ